MTFTCFDCGFSAFVPIGEAAIFFCYNISWVCPNCGVEIIFPKKECLEFVTGVWRN
jgi:predicted RNA-binding Zn-ribbon protein involved in translation (DUF1610 family)